MKGTVSVKMHSVVDSEILPYSGCFWIVDDTFVCVATKHYEENIDFSVAWNMVRDLFKVDGNIVSYDYYPRGRVKIKNEFEERKAYVYIDDCIFKEDFFFELTQEFKIVGKYCHLVYIGSNYAAEKYTCHKCRRG
jgi:hypothetical protein